jgi:hypothetical protein
MTTKRMSRLVWPLAVVLTGCIIDTVPTPEDRPPSNDGGPVAPTGATGATGSFGGLALSSVYYTLYPGSSAILLAGARSAAPGAGYVGVENPRTRSWVRRESLADGSFSLSVDATVGDVLRLVYYTLDASQNAVVLSQAYLEVRPASTDAISASVDVSTSASPGAGGTVGVSATAPDAVSGKSTVSGVAGVVRPGIVVVVVNPHGSASAVAAALDGSFATTISAKHSDLLVIFAVEPAVSQAGGPTTTISVP